MHFRLSQTLPLPYSPRPITAFYPIPLLLAFFRVSYFTTSSNSSTTRTALLLCNGNSFGAFFAEKPAKKFVKRWWKMDTFYESKTLISNLTLQLEFNFIYNYSLGTLQHNSKYCQKDFDPCRITNKNLILSKWFLRHTKALKWRRKGFVKNSFFSKNAFPFLILPLSLFAFQIVLFCLSLVCLEQKSNFLRSLSILFTKMGLIFCKIYVNALSVIS